VDGPSSPLCRLSYKMFEWPSISPGPRLRRRQHQFSGQPERLETAPKEYQTSSWKKPQSGEVYLFRIRPALRGSPGRRKKQYNAESTFLSDAEFAASSSHHTSLGGVGEEKPYCAQLVKIAREYAK